MYAWTTRLAAIALVCFVWSVAGCSKSADDSTPPADGAEAGDAADAGAADPVTVALAELSPADRELAEKQKFCPVGGPDSLLGSMGKPYKMEVGDRTIFLCCEHCKDKVNEDPDKYLAIVDEQLKTE